MPISHTVVSGSRLERLHLPAGEFVTPAKWDRSLGTSKREQGVVTPKLPKSRRQLKAAEKIAEKLAAESGDE